MEADTEAEEVFAGMQQPDMEVEIMDDRLAKLEASYVCTLTYIMSLSLTCI